MNNKNIFLLVVILAIFINCNAKLFCQFLFKPLAAFKANNEWFVIDENGNQMYSSRQILDVTYYSEDLLSAYIFHNRILHAGYFDDGGKLALKFPSKMPFPFKNGRALVMEQSDDAKSMPLFGIIDRNGKLIVPIEYYDVLDFTEGLGYIMNLEERGYIDTNGKMVINLDKGVVGYGFAEGLSPVSSSELGLFGFIDKNGKMVIDYSFGEVGNFSEGLCRVYKNRYFGFINKDGQFVIDTKFDEASDFREGLAFVSELDEEQEKYFWGSIDRDGVFVVDFRFDEYRSFSEGLAAVSEAGKWRYIDKNGIAINDETYRYCGSFKNGKAFVIMNDGTKLFIDKLGNQVLELPFAIEILLDCRTNERFEKSLLEKKQ